MCDAYIDVCTCTLYINKLLHVCVSIAIAIMLTLAIEPVKKITYIIYTYMCIRILDCAKMKCDSNCCMTAL